MHRDWLIFLLLAFLAATGLWASLTFLSREARLHRRRRKSHSRIISKAGRPMVRFSVKPPKDK